MNSNSNLRSLLSIAVLTLIWLAGTRTVFATIVTVDLSAYSYHDPVPAGDKTYYIDAALGFSAVKIDITNPLLHTISPVGIIESYDGNDYTFAFTYTVIAQEPTINDFHLRATPISMIAQAIGYADYGMEAYAYIGPDVIFEVKVSEQNVEMGEQWMISLGWPTGDYVFTPGELLRVDMYAHMIFRPTGAIGGAATFTNGPMEHGVSQTPLPPSVILLATGLLGLGGYRWRLRGDR